MIDTSLYVDIENDKKKMQSKSNPNFATVIEINGNGVKLRIDGEEQTRETYYNSLAQVNVGDRAYINYISGTILVVGKLQYK